MNSIACRVNSLKQEGPEKSKEGREDYATILANRMSSLHEATTVY